MQNKVNKDKIKQAIELFLEAIGEDPDREGLKGTPDRVARMWAEEFPQLRDYKATSFESDYDEMIQISLPIYSFCEHHILPMFGTAHITYIPKSNKILGLSKLGRIVNNYAYRLTLQERLTTQIAEAIDEAIEPEGVAVILVLEHLCISMRGVQKPGHSTKTSKLIGSFMDSPQSRMEMLNLINLGRNT